MITITVYKNRNNICSIALYAGGAATDLSGVTRIVMTIGSRTFDSRSTPEYFDWTTDSTQLDLKLGFAGLAEGTFEGHVTSYDTTYPNGLEWGDGLVVRVK